jgi:hypothetical protein
MESKWGDEIRLVLRSWEKNFIADFDEDVRVFIMGGYLPDWIDNVFHVRFDDKGKNPEQTHGEKFRWAIKNLESFIWSNDDIYLLTPIDYSQVKTPYCLGDLSTVKNPKRNNWGRKLWRTAHALRSNGKTILNGETHTPYYYESRKLNRVFEKYPFIESGAGLARTAYVNEVYAPQAVFNIAHHKAGFYSNDKPVLKSDLDKALFLNHDDNGLGAVLKAKLFSLFSDRSRFEV